jgi:hypothetical protein
MLSSSQSPIVRSGDASPLLHVRTPASATTAPSAVGDASKRAICIEGDSAQRSLADNKELENVPPQHVASSVSAAAKASSYSMSTSLLQLQNPRAVTEQPQPQPQPEPKQKRRRTWVVVGALEQPPPTASLSLSASITQAELAAVAAAGGIASGDTAAAGASIAPARLVPRRPWLPSSGEQRAKAWAAVQAVARFLFHHAAGLKGQQLCVPYGCAISSLLYRAACQSAPVAAALAGKDALIVLPTGES